MTAVLDAVVSATAGPPRLYELGSVPESPEYPYGVLSAALGRGDSYTLDAHYGTRWGRVTAQTFGKTLDSALALMETLSDSLLDVPLSIAGYAATGCRAELEPRPLRDPDAAGVVSVTASWTFTATKET